IVGGHAADVGGHFDDSGGIVFDGRAIAGATVGVGKIVINGLGDTDHPQFIVPLGRLFMDFVGRILRVVAADVEEIADVVRLKDLKQTVHVFGGLLGILFEIE